MIETETKPANGRCPDCLQSQHVSGSSTRCSNGECELVAPTSIFKQTLTANSRDFSLRSGQNRAWTLGGAVD